MLLSSGGVNYWHEVISTELDRVTEGTRVRPIPEEKEETLSSAKTAGVEVLFYEDLMTTGQKWRIENKGKV